MIGPVLPGASVSSDGAFNATPTLPGFVLIDSTGGEAVAHTTAGIVLKRGTTYTKEFTAPISPGFYTPFWDDNGGAAFPDEEVWVSSAGVAAVALTSTVNTASPSEFWIKQHDTREPYSIQIIEDDGTVVDLTDVTEFRFLMRAQPGSGSLLINNTANIDVVGAPTLGVVVYQWQTGDTATVGTFSAEVQLTFNDGRLLTAPTKNYLTVHVIADLGP